MAKSSVFTYNPDLSLPFVQPSTIQQFEKNAPDIQQLYQTLFDENEDLALWLRQRAEGLYDDLDDREAAVYLALEALAIVGNQTATNALAIILQAAEADKTSNENSDI